MSKIIQSSNSTLLEKVLTGTIYNTYISIKIKVFNLKVTIVLNF